MKSKPALYWTFIRPFTLLVPATGMVCGGLMALGAEPRWASDWSPHTWGMVLRILAGAVLAASLNAFSNGINQIYDLEVDRINKPHRLLPSGKLSLREGKILSLWFLLLSLSLAAWISPPCFLLVALAALLTYVYSAPPLRTKGRGIWANVTIAIPRGTLLVVAGWSTVKEVGYLEPWFVGGVFGFYFLGAVTTKDFSDVEGDRLGGCRTLPVLYGVQRAIRMIAPFFVLPFLAILPGTLSGILTGNRVILVGLGLGLPTWGGYIASLLLRTPPGGVASGSYPAENHPSWRHMYLLTLVAQLGFAAASLLR